jgi:hypothetical protein
MEIAESKPSDHDLLEFSTDVGSRKQILVVIAPNLSNFVPLPELANQPAAVVIKSVMRS